MFRKCNSIYQSSPNILSGSFQFHVRIEQNIMLTFQMISFFSKILSVLKILFIFYFVEYNCWNGILSVIKVYRCCRLKKREFI